MRKILARCMLGVVVLSAITACGFRPVYATYEDDRDLTKKLTAIEISSADTVINQYVRRSLTRLITPEKNKARAPLYVLELDANASHGALAIQLDQEVTRYKTTVSLRYSIKEKASGKIMRQGTLVRQGGYDVVESEYAEHVSRNDTEKRVASELAEDLKLDIISALLDASQ